MPCWWEWSTENDRTVMSWQKGYGNSDNHTVQLLWAGKHLRMHNTLTLRRMGYNSRRPRRVPLKAKNRKLKLQWAQAHQNWTVDWKNVAWSDESWFLRRLTDGSVRMRRQQHESMDPTCLVSTAQTGASGEMVWVTFSWHTSGLLIPINHCLNATANLGIVADHVHPFMATMYPSLNGYFQHDNAPCHKAKAVSNWFYEHGNVL